MMLGDSPTLGAHTRPSKTRRRSLKLLATGTAVALMAVSAGCGSDDDTASGTTAAGGKAASGEPIKVMTFADLTVQPPAPSYQFVADSVNAAIESANAAGGVNGRPIELITCDTKMDPNAATACGRKAVEEDVVAVVGGASSFDGQVASVVEKAGIPMIGPVAQSPPTYNGDLTYCHVFQTSSALGLFPKLAKDVGVTKLSLITAGGTPVTEIVSGAFKQGTEAAGLEVGNVVTPSPKTTNFAAVATQAAANGADGVVVLPFSDPASMAQQIAEQEPGLKLIMPSWAFSFGSKWPSSLNGTVALASSQPPTATEVPGIERYQADMKKYSPDTQQTETGAYEWLAGDWFVRVLKELDGDVTPKTVVAKMNTLKDFDMGGITPPYDSSKRGKVAVEKCGQNASGVHTELRDNQLYAVDPGAFLQ